MLVNLAIALSTFLFTPEQKQQAPKTQVMYVKENTVPCTGVAPMDCMQVRVENETEWSNFYSNIQGFKYVPGYQYKLLVLVTPVKNPPMDAPNVRYTLRKILMKKKVAITSTGSPFVPGKRWVLVEMNGTPINKGKIYLEFDASGNRYHGHGGCNGIGGEFNANQEAGIVSFKRGMSTLMACPDETDMRNESTFQQSLDSKTYNYRVENGRLNMYGNGKLLLSFKQSSSASNDAKPEQPDVWAFIASKKWNLMKLNDNTLTDAGIFLEFDPQTGRYHGRGGCNMINGTFKHTKTTIAMGLGMSTKMACGGDAMKREAEFLKTISGKTFRFDIAEQTLNLYEKNKLVMIFGMADKDAK